LTSYARGLLFPLLLPAYSPLPVSVQTEEAWAPSVPRLFHMGRDPAQQQGRLREKKGCLEPSSHPPVFGNLPPVLTVSSWRLLPAFSPATYTVHPVMEGRGEGSVHFSDTTGGWALCCVLQTDRPPGHKAEVASPGVEASLGLLPPPLQGWPLGSCCWEPRSWVPCQDCFHYRAAQRPSRPARAGRPPQVLPRGPRAHCLPCQVASSSAFLLAHLGLQCLSMCVL